MPTYDFKCKDCDKVYEELTKYDETGKYENVQCPHCESKNKIKQAGCCNYAFSNPVGTDKWNNTSTGHDYRFKYNIPKVKAERNMAEALSHMGSDPYGSAQAEQDIELDTGIHDPETRPGLA